MRRESIAGDNNCSRGKSNYSFQFTLHVSVSRATNSIFHFSCTSRYPFPIGIRNEHKKTCAWREYWWEMWKIVAKSFCLPLVENCLSLKMISHEKCTATETWLQLIFHSFQPWRDSNKTERKSFSLASSPLPTLLWKKAFCERRLENLNHELLLNGKCNCFNWQGFLQKTL